MAIFEDIIRDVRQETIKSADEYLADAMSATDFETRVLNGESEVLLEAREAAYAAYAADELDLSDRCYEMLFQTREEELLPDSDLAIKAAAKRLATNLAPYSYKLNLSITQSRRSRAGKTFEGLIRELLLARNIPFEDQANLKSFLTTKSLTRTVDFVLPSKESFLEGGDAVVISAKTSLRERWAEVADEQRKTGVENLFLVTVGDDLTTGILSQLHDQGITTVVPAAVHHKLNHSGLLTYDNFFNTKLPALVTR